MLLLLNCCSVLLLGCHRCCVLLLLRYCGGRCCLVLLLDRRCCSSSRGSLMLLLLLLLLVVDLDHGWMIPDIVVRWRRRGRLLFDDRWSLVVLVRNRHWLLLDGQVNQRSECIVSLHVVM